MNITPFVKNVLSLLFNIAVLVVVALIFLFIVSWAGAIFLIPARLIQLIGFLIFIYTAYKLVMLIIGFFESNPIN